MECLLFGNVMQCQAIVVINNWCCFVGHSHSQLKAYNLDPRCSHQVAEWSKGCKLLVLEAAELPEGPAVSIVNDSTSFPDGSKPDFSVIDSKLNTSAQEYEKPRDSHV